MFKRLIEAFSGKDDLERIACKGDVVALNAYLRTRHVLIPRRPKRFLDASDFTQEQVLEMIQKDAEELATTEFEPWVLEINGQRHLPAFSSQKKLTAFAKKISQDLNKVFGLGHAEFLIEEIARDLNVDFVDLNLFGEKSWEIGMKT
jgi:hypothetical protein